MSLDGTTPAEAKGIQVKGESKWLTIIQNASYPMKLDNLEEGFNPTQS
jgi:hypothetical protein